MNEEHKNIIYTAKDISCYIEGRLSAEQMHAMEKAALDDPFLAEAMEGYETLKEAGWRDQLSELHRRLSGKRKEAKVIPIRQSTGRIWRMIAAAVVIIFGTSITWWLTREKTGDKNYSPIAQNIKQTEKAPLLPHGAINPASDEPSFIKPDSPLLSKTSVPKPLSIDESKTRNTDQPNQAEYNATDKNKTGMTTSTAVIPNNATIPNIPVQGNMAMEDKLKKISSQPSNQRFIAQVVGPDNTPLPFANITISNENFGTYADVKGNFRLVSTDSLLNIEVKSVGFLPRSFTLRSSLVQNKIVLNEDENAFKEKTLARKANPTVSKTVSRRATLRKDSVVNVEPADGWDNYGTYLANNIEIPEMEMNKDKHGEVNVKFDVKRNGTISNIQVDESNCNSCGEAAKHALEHGPQWKVKKGSKASARITLQF